MKVYESIIIFKVQTKESTIKKINEKISKAIGKGGVLLKHDDWGIKKLAYEIHKEPQGRYFFWQFAQGPEIIEAIDKAIRFEEDILRSMTVIIAKRFVDAKTWTETLEAEGMGRELTGKQPGYVKLKRADKVVRLPIDYKDPYLLAKFITERGKIIPRRVSGVNALTQRRISTAVKRARQVALLSYVDGVYEKPERFDKSSDRHDSESSKERGAE